MLGKKIWACSLIVILAWSAVAMAGKRRHRSYPICLTRLPNHDYISRESQASDQAVSVSLLPVQITDHQPQIDNALRGPNTPENIDHVKIKLFQLPGAKLQVDHCLISQLALQLDDNGVWVLSLRADQNPKPNRAAPTIESARLEAARRNKLTTHLKRNTFNIKIRCFAAFPRGENPDGPTTGKPSMAEIRVKPFVVQQGIPRRFRETSLNADVRIHFKQIDRVEIEFFYR